MKNDGRAAVASIDPAHGIDPVADTRTQSGPLEGLTSVAPIPRRRPERPTDSVLRFQLFAETRGSFFADIDPALRENRLSHLLAAEIAHHRSLYPDASVDVIECAGRAVGRVVIATRRDVIVLVDLAMLVGWRRRGIGQRVLADCFRAACARGCPVWTILPSENITAARFFSKAGFTVIAETAAGTSMEWRPDPS